MTALPVVSKMTRKLRFAASVGVYVSTLPFAAFAVPTVVGELRRHFRDRGWMVRVPRRVQDLHLRIGTVVSEDWAVSKTIQRSIHAVTNDAVVFGRNEIGLQHFHGEIRKEVERGAN